MDARKKPFIWGQGLEPSQAIQDEYNEKQKKYLQWVADYRKAHDGAEPPAPRLLSLPVEVIDEDNIEQEARQPEQDTGRDIKVQDNDLDDDLQFIACHDALPPKANGISANNIFTSQILAARHPEDTALNKIDAFNYRRGEGLPYSEGSISDHVVLSPNIGRKF